MAKSGVQMDDQVKKPVSLKRRRPTDDDDDAENIMPPQKHMATGSGVSRSDSEGTRSLGSSSPLQSGSEDDAIDFSILPHPESNEAADALYSDDNSSGSQYPQQSSYNVLSPLENVLNGGTSSQLKRKHSKSNGHSSPRKRKCPFPSLSWGDSTDVWQKMCDGDTACANWKSHKLFKRHPGLHSRMRAILLDWLNEVSEVYKMHRETYHLTVNYIDRFLSNTRDVFKGRLQLIGITCLFIAAKVEEVYPPKISEFAYVTDGACAPEEITAEEIIILTVLQWNTTPMTVDRWLNVYMQLNSVREYEKSLAPRDEVASVEMKKYTFILPQYSSLAFVMCGQLVDLAVLHVEVNAFSNSLVAAAALAHVFSKEVALQVSSYTWEELSPCYVWLTPFAEVLSESKEDQTSEVNGDDKECNEEARAQGRERERAVRVVPDCGLNTVTDGSLSCICPNINSDQNHRIQMHNICLTLFDKVQDVIASNRIVRTPTTSSAGAPPCQPITPPHSNQKKEAALALHP